MTGFVKFALSFLWIVSLFAIPVALAAPIVDGGPAWVIALGATSELVSMMAFAWFVMGGKEIYGRRDTQ